MTIRLIVPAICFCLSACVQQSEQKWSSHADAPSPYSATLIETDYNNGESNEFQIRIDAAPNKWFFVEELNSGLIISPKPYLQWTSPNDLLVTVHTAQIDGQTRRRLGGYGTPPGSLTIRYVADQPRQ